MSYKITDEQKKALLQYSAQTLPDNPSREGFSAESIRKRMYKPIEKLIDLVNSVFDTAYTDVKSIITAIQSGDLFARSVASWSASYTYGADEITFYPSIGTYGAFVQSVVAGNTNNAPYVDGALNSAYWKEVVNFNTVTEDYFQQVQAAVTQAESAASEAETQATAAAASAAQAAGNEEATNMLVERALAYSEQAEAQANIASRSATLALHSEEEAQQSAQRSKQSATESALSATAAQGYAQQAQQYAQKHYQVVASVSELPRPGDSAFIYLVPTGSGTTGDSYSEYLWITESNDYEFIGTTADIDLSNYAQQNGTYPNMSVGKATADANGNNIVNTYATKAENNAKYTKPSTGIPESDLASAVQTSLGKADTAYQKPSGGIPKTDLASAVQTSLGKADTALQSVPLATSSKVGGVKPASKTSDMTQSVGVDSNGALWTAPGGGIKQNEVIAVESLPTATADSPDFVQTPDGKLYRKQTIQNDSLIGTWQFGYGMAASIPEDWTFDFTCDGVNYTGILIEADLELMKYKGTNPVTVYQFGWLDDKYKTINITDTSGITDISAFTQWMNQAGTKLPTYSYEEVGAGASGGITNAEVIEYAEQLPTASETSPNFVQTPDGTLYRKKAVEGGGLTGTWVFNDTVSLSPVTGLNPYEISFISNNNTYISIEVKKSGVGYTGSGTPSITAYDALLSSWTDPAYKTIQITDISSLTNVDEFTQWLTANATGGGASVSYEYVAMQEVPTPTTADNGKVLGVTNGAYALQEASGGGGSDGGIIGHTLTIYGDDRIKNFSALKSDLTVAKLGNLHTGTPSYDVTDVIAISFNTSLGDLMSIETQAEQFLNIVGGANSNIIYHAYTLNKDTDFKVSEIDPGGGGGSAG